MKNQTKAILASTIVLALALSSISGATYSWFSDTETIDLGIGIATIGVIPSLKIDGESQTIQDQVPIKVTTIGKFDITVPVKNNSPFPVDLSAKVVQTKEVATGRELVEGQGEQTGELVEGNAIEPVTVYFEKNESGKKNYTKAFQELWWSSWNVLTFKDGSQMVKMKPGDSTYEDVKSAEIKYRTGDVKKVNMTVQSQEFYFNLEDVHIEPGEEKSLSFTMNVGEGFDWNVIDDLRVVLDITQCSLHKYDFDNYGHIDIDITGDNRPEPILIMGQEIMVKISKDTIQDISKISVNYEKDGSNRTVTIVYYRDGTPVTSGIVGDVKITYTAGDIHGFIIAPASGGTYTFTIGNNSP